MVTPAASDRPRFRQDLVAEPIDDNGARFIDVMDPDSGNVFRFYEVEYSLACAMDGERDVAKIVQWAQEELGVTPSPKEVRTVIATLGELGYLESGVARAAEAATPAQRASADELAPGIVVGDRRSTAPPVADLELGHVVAAAPADTGRSTADDFELGAPGANTGRPARADKTSVDEVPLGVAGRGTDLSLDLSDQVAVRADDVKEAVRQSQVMRAVEVPQELLDSVEPVLEREPVAKGKPEPKPEAKPAAKAKPEPQPKPQRTEEPKRPEPAAAAKQQAKQPAPAPAAAQKPATKPAVELPKAPAPAEAPLAGPPAPQTGISPVLIGLLVIAALGAIAFFAYKYVIKSSSHAASVTPPPAPIEPALPPPPPPVETEKLASEQPAEQDVKSATAGLIEMIAATGTVVKAGDVISQLAGHKPIETEVASLEHDIDKRVQPELAQAEKDRDAAQAAGNKPGVTAGEAKIADRKKSLDDKQAKLAAKKAELDKYLVKAPAPGKVTAVAKANARVTPNDVVAKLMPQPVLVATFKSANVGSSSHVLLSVKDGDRKLACVVMHAEAGAVKIACPQGAATEGAEVTFVGPDPAAASGGGVEIEMGDEGSGAKPAAGSAAGSAAAGSAAVGSGSGAAVTPAPVLPHPVPAVHPTPDTAATPPSAPPADKPADGDPAAGSAATP